MTWVLLGGYFSETCFCSESSLNLWTLTTLIKWNFCPKSTLLLVFFNHTVSWTSWFGKRKMSFISNTIKISLRKGRQKDANRWEGTQFLLYTYFGFFGIGCFACRQFHSLGNLFFFQTEQAKPPPRYYLLTARKTVNHDSTHSIVLTETMLAVVIWSLSSYVWTAQWTKDSFEMQM